MQIWRAFDGLFHHLLLMMIFDCLLAIRYKKGGVHMDGDRGSFWLFGTLEL